MEKKYYVKVTKYETFWYSDEEMTILHRENGPAIEYTNGDKHWYQNGKRHRLDGPAVEYANGDKEWWQNDKRHREDGPAYEWSDGSKIWLQNNKRHRLDGPAAEYANGTKEYWYQGEHFPDIKTNKQWKKHLKWMKFQ